ncbi:DJ-1 family glyoxalase III [Saccharicrinis sp. FJH62]|uniref:DJ-1 family glyoxalase III n=1 Tax=Saccharicrinis sp. FJH62 TaxID=3344657 RepID=UPI0035D4B207
MVYVHFAEGFEEIEAVSIVDVLRRAGIPVKMISVTGDKLVAGNHSIPVMTDVLFENADYSEADMLVLPGGLPGAHNLRAHKGLESKLLQYKKEGKWIGAVCAAPYVLGDLGILEGEKATCYPGFEDHLDGAVKVIEPALISGKVVTGRGPGVAIKFALKIVEALKGVDIANEVAHKMLVD